MNWNIHIRGHTLDSLRIQNPQHSAQPDAFIILVQVVQHFQKRPIYARFSSPTSRETSGLMNPFTLIAHFFLERGADARYVLLYILRPGTTQIKNIVQTSYITLS
ncbi:hypothetical protein AXG53_14245 [Stenotrophomonas sp. KCTC 12332]|nr:hypothetical protein AXG53_14245 [Stenotrophomonas sp. KCTC 12332]